MLGIRALSKLLSYMFALSFDIGGVYADDRVPVGQTDSVEFHKIYESILTDAGINYQMLVAPTARKRRMFVEGKILIDCCTTPSWRTHPEELATQLHSKTFIHSEEHYFFHQDSDIVIPSLDDLKDYRIAIVHSFVYANHDKFGQVVYATNIAEMMLLVALGRAQVGLINPYDFVRRLEQSPLPLRLGGLHELSPLSIRVHKSRADLLQKINAVIDDYLATGKVQKMLDKVGVPPDKRMQQPQ